MSKEENLNGSELKNLYTDLNKICTRFNANITCTHSEFEKAINISNKILEKYPEEFKAFQSKIVALIQLERFEDALRHLNKHQSFNMDLLFEKSYCEYRLNRFDEATSTIKNADESDLRIQELLGQILYKQQFYEEALEKYKFLMRNIHNAYEDERVVNMAASVTALSQWLRKKKDFPKVAESTFEILFNKAGYLAANGQYDDAIKKLHEAEEICLQTFEGDQEVKSEDIDRELSPIATQRAYCLQKLNRIQEANSIYHELFKKRCADAHILAVAANNVVCINRDQNIFDSRKKIKIATSDSLKQQLVSCQKQQIEINNFLFQYYSNQGDSVRALTGQFLKANPQCIKVALIKTAQLVKEKQTPQAIAFLEEYLEMIEKTDIGDEELVSVQLTLAQLQLSQGSVSRCNEILSDLPINYQHRFGVLGTRVSLYLVTEDIQSAIECLDTAIEWYKAEAVAMKKGPTKDTMFERYDSLLKTSANFCVRNKKPEQGARYFEQLLQRNPNCQSVLASLIAAYSRFDKEKAEKTSSLLKDDDNIPEIDVDSLESAFIFGAKHMKKLLKGEMTPSKTPGEISISSAAVGGGGSQLHDSTRKMKKKRKSKLPKNFDPKKILDAERWVPKRERAHYRGRKRDKRANMFRGPQGATGGATELDASKKLSAPNTPAAELVKKPQPTQAPKPKPKGKNKKKLKW